MTEQDKISDEYFKKIKDLEAEIAFLKSQFEYAFHDLKIHALTQNQILALKNFYEIKTGKRAGDIR